MGTLIVGRFEGHGAANYRFQVDQSPSYFLKVLTERGMQILWGKDLARAVAKSVTHVKIGDRIGVRRTGVEEFAIRERAAGTHQTQDASAERIVRRTRWQVEHARYFADGARLARLVRDAHADARAAMRAHPELKSTFLSLRAAEAFAAQRIADPEDRAEFLARVRQVMASSLVKRVPLPEVRIREGHRARSDAVPAKAPVRTR
jgi:hypothetical protein